MLPSSRSVGTVMLKKTVSLLHPKNTTETLFELSDTGDTATFGLEVQLVSTVTTKILPLPRGGEIGYVYRLLLCASSPAERKHASSCFAELANNDPPTIVAVRITAASARVSAFLFMVPHIIAEL